MSKKIVIIGATSAIAEHCARLWAEESPEEIILVGRDLARLEKIATDLRVRSPATTINMATLDFLDQAQIQQFVDGAYTGNLVDIVLVAHGSLPVQEDCQNDLAKCREALEVNGISPVLFAEAFVKRMEQANHGTLAVIGSVAGDRGRKSNYVYGSAKGLITRYVQGLQHRVAFKNVRVILVKPGPTNTPMTAHLKGQGASLADVQDVARVITKGIERRRSVVYAPRKWVFVMMAVRHLPRFIFNKMDI